MAECLTKAVGDDDDDDLSEDVQGLEELIKACLVLHITKPMLVATGFREYQPLVKGSRFSFPPWLTEMDTARPWVEKRHTALAVKVGRYLANPEKP